MERATPAHIGRERPLGLWARLGRLWSDLLNILRADDVGPRSGTAAPTGPAVTEAPPPPRVAPPADDVGAGTAPPPPEIDPPTSAAAADPMAVAIAAVTADLARRPPAQAPLISIVAVIPEWTPAAAAAVQSVRDQSYAFWELVVVDTCHPPQPPRPAGWGDGRIRVLLAPGADAATAHNRGLDAVQGQLVTSLATSTAALDGPATAPASTMAPGWLAALAWACGEWPGADLFLGTRCSFSGAVPGPDADLGRLVGEGRAHLRPAESGADSSAVAQRRERGDLRWAEGGDVTPTADLDAALRRGEGHRVPALATLSAEQAQDGAGDVARPPAGS